MEVKIISKEAIKPSSPTPNNLRNFKLSFLDQLLPQLNGKLVYFYASHNNFSVPQISQNLKKSLSNTLTLFYPYAGKTVDNIKIDCNDNGALYIEARVDIPLSLFLQRPDDHDLNLFLPKKSESSEERDFFSLFQVSFFTCGGFGIGLSVSHTLVDSSSAYTFIKTWAASMSGNFTNVRFPVYEASNLFPAKDILAKREIVALNFPEQRLPCKRLLFNSSKIASLKSKFKHFTAPPSKSEIITALIWKSALNAARARSNSRSLKYSMMSRAVNIRTRILPSLSSNSIGNLIGIHRALTDESEVDLAGLIVDMRKGLREFDEKVVKMLKTEEGLEGVVNYMNETARFKRRDDVESYVCTSLCNVAWYDMELGWGSPVWVTVPVPNVKNWISLIDRRDGSVEARVVLSEEDMGVFERDPELLAYACLNPRVMDMGTSMLKSCM